MRNRIAALLLATTFAACSGSSNGGQVNLAAQAAQFGPILQRCTELRTLDLVEILDAVRTLLALPEGPFNLPVDLDGDGTTDVTVSGDVRGTGTDTFDIDWMLTGALEGSGTLMATRGAGGAVTFNGSGDIIAPADPDECTFSFDLMDTTLTPPQLAGGTATSSRGGSRVNIGVDYVASVPGSSGGGGASMGGTVATVPPQYCVNSPTITFQSVDRLAGDSSGAATIGWPSFCFSGGGPGGVAPPPELLACVEDAITLLNDVGAEFADVITAVALGGPLPSGVVPVNATTYSLNLVSGGLRITGQIVFPQDPTTGIPIGSAIIVNNIQVDEVVPPGDPVPVRMTLAGGQITLVSIQSIRLLAEAADIFLDDCLVETTPNITFNLTGTTVTDITGTLTINSIELFNPFFRAESWRGEFLTGPNLEIRDDQGNVVATIPLGL